MKAFFRALATLLLLGLAPATSSYAQSNQERKSLDNFPFKDTVPLKIVRNAIPSMPFSVIGPRGAIVGVQDGSFEAWIFPWKIFSNFRIKAEMKDYPVPIDVNEHAAMIEVRPDHTTITYAHANFTIREVLFAPHAAPDGAGVLAFFQIEAVRPMTLTLEFTPVMQRMWPASSDDHSSAEWVKTQDGGFYVLHQSFPDHAAAVEMPGAEPGILVPYQERAKTYPAQFVLHFDPARDRDTLFPLLLTMGNTVADSRSAALQQKLAALDESMKSLYEDTGKYYRDFLDQHIAIRTPDRHFDDALAWSEASIDQLKVQTTPGHRETALVAGIDRSDDSARPGFGWYFGRDSLWTLYAVNAYGDFQLTRDQLEFLLHRQGPTGQIIHESSQTADIVDWKSLPYQFASSDATPLLLMATNDYYQISNDANFLKTHWDALMRAWDFETSRDNDTDGDGIYENVAGSGWVESWPTGMPHQEIYLAALDQQASTAFSNIAKVTGHPQIAEQAAKRASNIAAQIEKEYFLPKADFYAFSHNADRSADSSATIYPAVAAWDGTFQLAHSGRMLRRWASSEFSTDWGTRDLSPSVSFFDPISYHQGSVWPLFTGWVSLSEYRNGRSLSGYAHLMQNADLTWAQNPGAVTELLSGQFYRWLGRSSSHQLWSSAMVFIPTIRGMFGLEWNAPSNTLIATPNLPAQWTEATISGVPVGEERVNVEMRRSGTNLLVRLTGVGSSKIKLISREPRSRTQDGELQIPLSAVEVGIDHALPEPGAATTQMKVLDQLSSERSLQLVLSAPANSEQTMFLRINDGKIHLRSEGAEISSSDPSRLRVQFPSGTGYVEKTVTLSW